MPEPSSHEPKLQIKITATHRRRLREFWRSAGWPCRDIVEAELLVAGFLERSLDTAGRETLRVTEQGVTLIAETVQLNRDTRAPHDRLVAQVAREMQRAGRIVWTGLSLRAPPHAEDTRAWPLTMPDVFSIRHTTIEDRVEPIAHEIKVRRADLLSDLKNAAKREAYRAIASQCWYVLKRGIGTADEIPIDYGVVFADGHTLDIARPAPARAMRLPFMTWMVLARAAPCAPLDDGAQDWLHPVD